MSVKNKKPSNYCASLFGCKTVKLLLLAIQCVTHIFMCTGIQHLWVIQYL